jgi:hypothetical protein
LEEDGWTLDRLSGNQGFFQLQAVEANFRGPEKAIESEHGETRNLQLISPRPDLREKYSLTSLEVTGLSFGAKGTITKSSFSRFWKDHKLLKQLLEDVATIAVKRSH